MRRFLATLVVAGGCLAGASAVQAATTLVAPGVVAAPGIVLVEGGCGPYGFRDRFGYCHPRGAPPPRYYGCRPGFHPTPYGCRPNY